MSLKIFIIYQLINLNNLRYCNTISCKLNIVCLGILNAIPDLLGNIFPQIDELLNNLSLLLVKRTVISVNRIDFTFVNFRSLSVVLRGLEKTSRYDRSNLVVKTRDMNEQLMKKNIEKMGYNLMETLASRGKRRGHFFCSPSKLPREYHLSDARKYWRFPPSSIGRAKFSTKEMLTWSDSKIKNFIERSIEQRNKKQDTTAYLNKVSKWILNENVHHVLDFGCGLGQDGVYFSLLGIQITFADIISSNIELTKRYPNIWNIPTKSLFINTDPKDFVFPEKYDMIFSNGVLHHIPEAKAIVKNLAKYLKKGSLFICMLYTPAHFKATGARSLKEYALLSEGAAPVINPYTDYYTKERAEFLFEGFILQDYWKTNKGKFGWYVFRRLD